MFKSYISTSVAVLCYEMFAIRKYASRIDQGPAHLRCNITGCYYDNVDELGPSSGVLLQAVAMLQPARC